MITARIETQKRVIPIECGNNQESAISALQNSVHELNKEDGRCRFVVLDNGTEIHSWEYQPTFRPDLKTESHTETEKPTEEEKYLVGLCCYILLNGKSVEYDNFYMDGKDFDDAKAAHAFMKERGYSRSEYRVVYEYCVSNISGSTTYGFGMGFSKETARLNLNKDLAYYQMKMMKNGQVKDF